MGWDAIQEGREYNPLTDNAAGRIVSPVTSEPLASHSSKDATSTHATSGPIRWSWPSTNRSHDAFAPRAPIRCVPAFAYSETCENVVAVVNDVKHRSLDADAGLEAYIPMGQAPTFFQAYDLVVRSGDPIALVPAVRDAIWSVDPNQALGTPVRLESYVDRTLRPRRLLTDVLGVFAGSALLLAAFGVYGVVGYRVASRMKEIAIRVALGAPRWRVTGIVLSDTVSCVAIGLAAGIPLSLAAAATIRSYLFGVEPGGWRHACRGGVRSGHVGRSARRLPPGAPCSTRRSDHFIR